MLTGASLAPGTDETFDAMQNRRPQEVVRNILQNILKFEPDVPVQVDRKAFLKCLKSAPKGSSHGPGQCTYEHLRILVDDVDTMEILIEAVTSLAQARVPQTISQRIDVGQTHSAQEGRRRSERHCHRVHFATTRRTDIGETVR